MVRTLLTLSTGLVLVASGVVHGVRTDRWTANPEELRIAAERLAALPVVIGMWDGTDFEMKDDTRMGLAGVLARRYVNRETGKAISIYLACGRPGPASIHTPDVCYRADGYTDVEPPRRVSLPMGDKSSAEFWTARYVRSRPDGQTNLRIFWAWHTSAGWQVADNPRTTFAGESVLHKLYVIRELASANDPAENELCAEFVHELLPVLQEQLFAK
jgi:hypothetical protein